MRQNGKMGSLEQNMTVNKKKKSQNKKQKMKKSEQQKKRRGKWDGPGELYLS